MYVRVKEAGIAQSVEQRATSWTIWGSNAGGGETGSEANPESCTTGTSSFPRVKRPARGADHPLHSSAALRMGWNKSLLVDLEACLKFILIVHIQNVQFKRWKLVIKHLIFLS